MLVVAMAGCGAAPDPGTDGAPAVDAMAAADGAPQPTSGCGTARTPGLGATESIDVVEPGGGTRTRTYRVRVPDGYDQDAPARLVFGWPGTNGTPDSLDSRGVWSVTPAIYVYPQPLPPDPPYPYCPQGANCWDQRSDGNDIAFFDQLLAHVEDGYCVDAAQVSSFGFSSGAIFSDLLACKRQAVIHGIAMVEGLEPFVETPATFDSCGGAAIPYLQKQNDGDTTVTVAAARVSRDHWVTANGCSAATQPWAGGAGCVEYVGCDAPVVWCEYAGGGHSWDAPQDSQSVGSFLGGL